MRDYDFNGEPFVVIERQDSGIGNFLLGISIGVGAALLFAPRAGTDTRRLIGDRARRAGETVLDTVNEVSDRVAADAADVRDRVTDTVDSARDAVRRRQDQVLDAIDAGRAAAAEGRAELERKIAENKASRREVGSA
ncbi:MAG: YtxH domain-containing protein [Gemmatimonadaceae bacterium]